MGLASCLANLGHESGCFAGCACFAALAALAAFCQPGNLLFRRLQAVLGQDLSPGLAQVLYPIHSVGCPRGSFDETAECLACYFQREIWLFVDALSSAML